MKIKSVALNEIHWTIEQWNQGQQANDRLSQKLGPACSYFAKCNVGANFYSWTVDAPGKWTPLSDAPENDAIIARQKWEEVKQEVVSKLAPASDLSDKILTVPNEEYIFYRIDPASGQAEILITGWGFRNFKKAGPHLWGGAVQPETAHPVDVSFTVEGVVQPGRPFAIIAPKTRNEYVTDAQGVFRIGEKIEPGTVINLQDGPTEKEFQLVVEEQRIDYTFDVTEFVTLKVLATLDGNPIEQGDLTVKYGNDNYDLMLSDGRAALNLPLREGTPCTVTFGDEQKTAYLTLDDSTIRFDRITPKVEEPVVEETELAPAKLVKITVLDSSEQPMKSQKIAFRQDGNVVQELQLDENGSVMLDQDLFNTAAPLTAQLTDTQLPEVEFTFEEGETEYVLQQQAAEQKSRAAEVLVAILLLAALAGIGYATYLGIKELVPLIHQNIL